MSFPFLKLPDIARRQVYSHLGFQVEPQVTLFSDKHKKSANAIQVRQRYNIDFNRSGHLSQPWTRAVRENPRVCLAMMLVNHEICDELYALLYSNCVFMVHLQGSGKTHARSLTPRACRYITHLTLSYNIHANSTKHHELLFNTRDEKEALVAAISAVTAPTPNLMYFGINFWSPSLKRLFPNFSFDAQPDRMQKTDTGTRSSRSSISKTSNTSTNTAPDPTARMKPPLPFTHSWLLPPISALIQEGNIKIFALLRDGLGCGVLDWDRERRNIMKGINRDLMRTVGKVVT